MAVFEQADHPSPGSKTITLPPWWKTAVAFIVGLALATASLVMVVPGSLADRSRAALGGSGSALGEGEEIFLGEDGQEYYIDEEGNVRLVVGEEGTAGSTTAGTAGRAGGASGGRTSAGGGTGGTSGGSGGGSGACKAGQNGGATDIGVTGGKINLATTAVLSDSEAVSLLQDSVTGMKAVMDKVNKGGGICGRILELKVDNDKFDAQTGAGRIRSYIDSKQYFALPVVPSAEGLSAAIGFIRDAGMPVVGTDGMRKEQYSEDWIWPVATATESTMRIMAKYGYETKGARTFAIVWDSKYKFGFEGKNAFISQVAKMPGCAPPPGDPPEKSPCIKISLALEPEQPSYGDEVLAFNAACGNGKCDMVAFLLLPDPAARFLGRNPAMGAKYTAGAQTLFTDRFGEQCVQAAGAKCHGLAAWTGYNPPVGALASKPGVAAYVNEVRLLNPSIDTRNQFLQGAYLGMSVFVEGLKRVGPGLTRAALRAEMDKMDYSTDLTSTLSWRPGNHWANVHAQSFVMNVTQGQFNDWAPESGFVRDPGR